MGKVIKYNSWKDKAPFGALRVNQESEFVVRLNEEYNVSDVRLVLFKDDEEVGKFGLNRAEDSSYSIKINELNQVGLYFYYFEVDAEIDGKAETLFYGKSKENGNACEYKFDDINKYQITVHEDFKVPDWYKEGIMYQIFVDRFNNGNRNKKPNNPKENSFIYANWTDTPMYIKDKNDDVVRWDFYGGNLKGITEKLAYLKKMGVSIIYLNPIFESASNHKYSTGDFEKIDPMFGDEEVFAELIEKAEQRGISIILDGVFSHTGADSKYFNKYGNYDSVGAYQSQESKYSSWYKFKNFPEEYESWWGVNDLPNVNELDPSYMDYIIKSNNSILKKWTSMGVKGWRLDVADELPTQFIREFKKELKENYEDTVLVGEVWEDASNKVSYGERRSYLFGSELDSVMGYPFRENVVDFLEGKITSEQLNNKFMTIKENYPKESFKSNLNLISSHDVTRIKTELNEDSEKVKLAVAIQATFEGVPHIYYGDEAGLCGGVDPDNRRTYPWKNEDEDMIEFYKEAMNTRKKYSTLIHGDTEFINTLNEDVFAFIRFTDDEKVLVLINRSEEDINLNLNLEENTLEEIDIKYSAKKYLERFSKEESFNIDLKPKTCRIFNILNIVEE
ncbi:MAG: glycoside hydrolase family 13 protein [Peptostreptococcaceae bacterium]